MIGPPPPSFSGHPKNTTDTGHPVVFFIIIRYFIRIDPAIYWPGMDDPLKISWLLFSVKIFIRSLNNTYHQYIL